MLALAVLACLAVVPCQSALYSYGPGHGDANLALSDDGSSSPISTQVSVFLGDSEYNRLWINANGLISFHGSVYNYRPYALPMSNNWKVVAPFWADVNLRATSAAPDARLYHRQTTDQSVLSTAGAAIRAEFSTEHYNYNPSWAYVITWHRVTYYGSPRLGGPKRNTFQVVLVSDGVASFAIFEYGSMTWSLGTASSNTHAVAGFDANDGHHYMLPGSLTSSMASISGSRVLQIGGADTTASPCHRDVGRQIRLTQGRLGNTMEGYAQFKQDGEWKSICSRGWGQEDATVFCNQLGYPGDAEHKRNGFFGTLPVELDYAMERVRCDGDEECLVNCTRADPSTNCGSGNEAGVICAGAHDDGLPIRLAGTNGAAGQGSVEVDIGSHYVKVCDAAWSEDDANVLCQHLGFSAGLPTRNSFFDSTPGVAYGFSRFRCEGDENSLFGCPYDDTIDASECGDNDAAGVICYTSEEDNFRLVTTDGISSSSFEGNIEMQIGSTYRRVCDIGFGDEEAEFVCKALDSTSEVIEVYRDAEYGDTGSDLPFFHFRCEGDENKLFECLKPLSGTTCEGGQVAGVKCSLPTA